MKTRVVLILAVIVLTVFPGCVYQTGSKHTGLTYIMDQVRAGADDRPSQRSTSTAAPGKRESTALQIPRVDKTVYLTFDDGPDITNTPMVLNILDNYGVKATFFVVGTNIEKNPEIFKDTVKRGHAIGNHTYNHKYNDVYSGTGGFMESIKTNEELIFRYTGQRPRIVRDPGGEARNNGSLKRVLAQNGYWLVDWNVDSHDSRKPSPEGAEIVENIRWQMMNKNLWPGVVILMHDGAGHLNSVRALPTVIEMLQNQGFKFEVLK